MLYRSIIVFQLKSFSLTKPLIHSITCCCPGKDLGEETSLSIRQNMNIYSSLSTASSASQYSAQTSLDWMFPISGPGYAHFKREFSADVGM